LFRPTRPVVLALALVFAFPAVTARAESEASPKARLDQAITQLQAGQVSEAQTLLHRIDPMALSKQQRVRMYEALQSVDAQLREANQQRVEQLMAADATADMKPIAQSDVVEVTGGEPATVEEPAAEGQAVADTEQTQGQPEPDPVAQTVEAMQDEAEAESQPETQPQAQPEPVQAAPRPEAASADLIAQARRLRVQELIAQGDQAAADDQYRLAEEHYQNALSIEPNNQVAQTRLAQVQQEAAEAGPSTLLKTELQNAALRRRQTVAEYNDLMANARQAQAEDQFSQATGLVSEAKVLINRNQRFLTGDQYRSLRQQAIDLSSAIAQDQQATAERQATQVEQQRQAENERRRRQAMRQQQEQIDSLLRKAVELRRAQEYDQALDLIDRALFIDKTNPAAQFIKEMVEDEQVFVQQKKNNRKRDLMVGKQAVINREALIPYDEIVTYPSEWPEITARRLARQDPTAGDSPENRRVAERLEEPITVNFQADRLTNVLELIRNQTGVRIVENWNRLEAAGVERDLPISLKLADTAASKVLELVLQQASVNEFEPVGYEIIEGIVEINTERELRQRPEIRLYDIRDFLVTREDSFSNRTSFDLESALDTDNQGGDDGGGGGGGDDGGLFGDDDDEDDEDEGPSRGERIEQISSLIRDLVGRQEEWREFGGDVSSLRELNGNLIIRTTRSNHLQVVDIIELVRETFEIQISVEARFLLVNDNFLEDIGVDLDIAFDNLPGDFGPFGASQDSIGIAQPGGGSLGLTPSQFTPDGSASLPNPADFIPGSGFATGAGRALTTGFSYLDDLQVNLLVTATQNHRRSVSLTAPRVTFENGGSATVTVATQISFVSDLTPVPDADGFDVTLSVVQTGVILAVEAAVSNDKRYVTMAIAPQLARVNDIRRIEQTAVIDNTDGGDGDDGDDPAFEFISGFVEAPELEITSVQATVSVPDRGTLLVGGQRLVEEVQLESGVPVLSKIPVLNRLFTNQSEVRDERTLLILVKPTIIIPTEEEESLFPGLLQNPGAYVQGQEF